MTSVPTAPLFADPRRLLLEMARERTLPDLLRLVVDRLAESPRVALARIWLVRRVADRGGGGGPPPGRRPPAPPHPGAPPRPAAAAPPGGGSPPGGGLR